MRPCSAPKLTASHENGLTLGAVVLTLNATGCPLLLVICRARFTDWVNGPAGETGRGGGTTESRSGINGEGAKGKEGFRQRAREEAGGAGRRTVEPQDATGVERDGHFGRGRGRAGRTGPAPRILARAITQMGSLVTVFISSPSRLFVRIAFVFSFSIPAWLSRRQLGVFEACLSARRSTVGLVSYMEACTRS